MKYLVFFVFMVAGGFLYGQHQIETHAVDLVNPFIGTGGHGHTFPGATAPFGMVQLSPDTRLEGWDGCSGYHYTDSIVYGFSHTHLSGTGVSDYGDILFMPTSGEIKFDNGYKEGEDNGYASRFSKEKESAWTGYYATYLDDYNIKVELTCTERTGIHQYTFDETGEVHVILDLEHRDKLLDHQLDVVDSGAVKGFRISQAWANEQHIYFFAHFSKPFKEFTYNGKDSTKAAFTFDVMKGERIMLKVGISAVDEAGAENNLRKEAGHWDFTTYNSAVVQAWSRQLNKIKILGATENDLVNFYTALYHNMIAPNIFSDVDGRYRGMDRQIHQDKKQKTYTVFSLWDTFRATHPLYTIIEQEKTNEFINTFLKQYEQGGLLPVWELAGNETNCMIGFHSASVIADAYIKNIRDYDYKSALDAMIRSSYADDKSFVKPSPQYVNAALNAESVSKTLEYAYDNWCIQLMLDSISPGKNIVEPAERMFAYRNLFDKETGFMRPRKNGGWFGNFDPTEVNFHFTEANSWQYSMFVPHNISDLISMHGGDEAFEKKLDELFNSSSEMGGRHQSDITGLIGQYAHGNEPSHHMAYLYNYIGKPWKTQKMVRRIMKEMYSNAPDGLVGNEDCGQMSAWYIFSAMGFYPVTPGLPYYTIGTPSFNDIVIHLENGNKFRIVAKNKSENNFYIQSIRLNGLDYPYSYIKHSDIMKGGELVFMIGNTPNKKWGSMHKHRPVSEINREYETLPVIIANSNTFSDSLEIMLDVNCDHCVLSFNVTGLNEDEPVMDKRYDKPFYITKTSRVNAYSTSLTTSNYSSESAVFYKIDQDREIELISKYANQYAAAGNNALIDKLRGSNNFRTGDWQGYQGQDLEALVTFDSEKEINSISLSCLQDIQSWIWYPKQVTIYSSLDNESWNLLGTVKNSFSDKEYGAFIQELTLEAKIKTKFIKIVAENYGVCPEWHLGAGGEAWIFVDEIIIE